MSATSGGPVYLSVEGQVLGGYGHEFEPGSTVDALFEDDGLALLGDQSELDVPYADVLALSVGGPGSVTTGGGWVGGGFGVVGTVTGVALASVMNGLTARTKVVTILRITTPTLDLYLHHDRVPPARLEMALSPVFGRLRAAAGKAAPAISTVGELESLASMLRENLITRNEFDRLKAELMASVPELRQPDHLAT